jgi:endoglucanase
VSGFIDKHAHPAEDNTRVVPSNELFLDVGARNKEDALPMGIAPGNLIAPWSPFTRLAQGELGAV